MEEFDEIKSLELDLADPEVRKNTARLGEIIADDFEEFGSSGKVYCKDDIISSLSSAESTEYELENFVFAKLSEDCILVKYGSNETGRVALRSSIWRKTAGRWQIFHHQATVVMNLD